MGGAGVRSPTGIRFQIPSDPDWIDFTVQILVQHAERTNACDLLHLGHLRVSLFEALTNSVIHGNLQVPSKLRNVSSEAYCNAITMRAADENYSQRAVDVEACVHCDRSEWSFMDQGRGFDVASALATADRNVRSPEPTGRGIPIICALMDEVHYDDAGRRVRLALHRNTRRPEF